jgi:hypothetical protein
MLHRDLLCLAYCLLLLVCSSSADTLKTDRNVYPEPVPPPLPRAGSTFVDPTFGTTLLRVTDESDGPDNKNAYSYWSSLNCNNTRLFYLNGNTGMVCDFDAASLHIGNKRPLWASALPTGGLPWTEDAMWSGIDPDVIYTHQGMRIWAYNVRSMAYSLVVDLTGRIANAANLQQMSKSNDDAVFGFNLQDANWQRIGFIAWKRTGSFYYEMTSAIDEVEVDKTGQYLVVMTGQQGSGGAAIESRIVNLASGQTVDLTDGAPDYSPGHKDVGHGTVAGEDNWLNTINWRTLASPHSFYPLISFGNDWSQGKHVSMLGDDGWLLVSMFVANTLPNSGLFKNELFMVSTDGFGRVRRLCHHHSTVLQSGTISYWDSPRADISSDGRFAVFTSNWGNLSRRDVFIVRIPAESEIIPPPPPIAPPTVIYVDTTAVPIRSSEGAAITFSLSAPASARIEYGVSGQFNLSVSRPAVLKDGVVLLLNLANATTYNYRVVTIDAAGNEFVSRVYYFTTFRSMIR